MQESKTIRTALHKFLTLHTHKNYNRPHCMSISIHIFNLMCSPYNSYQLSHSQKEKKNLKKIRSYTDLFQITLAPSHTNEWALISKIHLSTESILFLKISQAILRTTGKFFNSLSKYWHITPNTFQTGFWLAHGQF